MPKAHDIAWKHCKRVEGKPNATHCNYCEKNFSGGGITRFKYHMAGGHKDVEMCKKNSTQVRKLFQKLLEEGKEKKLEKQAATQRYKETLCGVEVSSDDEESEVQFLRDQEASIRFDNDQLHRTRFHGSQREKGVESSSRRANTSAINRSSSVRMPRGPTLETVDADVYRRSDTSQRTIKQTLQKDGKKFGEKFRNIFAKFTHYGGIAANQVVNNPYAQPMIDEACRAGLGVKIPSAYDLLHRELDNLTGEVDVYIDDLRKKWVQYGVTIMCDGWTGPTRKSLVNFMVYCDGKTAFVKSFDVSSCYKDYRLIRDIMKEVVDWVGKENVVQIVTDNGANYKKAGEQLSKMPGYNLYWTGCAAHCVDLMLKEFSKRKSNMKVIGKARKMTGFIYNHSRVLSLMRKHCGGDIIRPATTRFATNFLALQSLYSKKDKLRAMIIDEEWNQIKLNTSTAKMENIEYLIDSKAFWGKVKGIVECLEPLVLLLRNVDSDQTPGMGYIHRWVEVAVEKIQSSTRWPEWVIKMIDRRWTEQLTHPLHKAAYYLNPVIQYGPDSATVGTRSDLISAMRDVISKLVPDPEKQNLCMNQTRQFRDSEGMFSHPMAVRGRSKDLPADWWINYGTETPELKDLAVRILSQTVSSSGCERNWSTFGMIHSNKRCKLSKDTLHKLVYVHYNLRLKAKNCQSAILKDKEDVFDISKLYPASDGDDAPFDWIREDDSEAELDENGRPNTHIATQMGVNVEDNLVPPRDPVTDLDVSEDHEDALGDHPGGEHHGIYASPTDSDDSDDGNDSNDGNGGADPVQDHLSSGRETMNAQSPIRFTGEADYQYATQDEDHGGRLATWGRGQKRSRQRRPNPTMETGSSHWSQSHYAGENRSNSFDPIRQDNLLSGNFDYPVPAGYYSSSTLGQSRTSTGSMQYPVQSSNPEPFYASSSYDQSQSGQGVGYGEGQFFQSNNINEWLTHMTSETDQSSSSIPAPIREYSGYPLTGYLVTCCDDQASYDTYLEMFTSNYMQTMTWQYFCHTFLREFVEYHYGPNYEPPRRSTWY